MLTNSRTTSRGANARGAPFGNSSCDKIGSSHAVRLEAGIDTPIRAAALMPRRGCGRAVTA